MSSMKYIFGLFYLVSSVYLNPVYCQSPDLNDDNVLNMIYSKNILPHVDFRDAAASIEIWTKELLSEIYTEYSLNNIFVDGIDQIDEKFINDKTSFIILTALEYLTNKEKLKNVTPTLLSSDDDGIVGIEYVVLVNKNSNINSLVDLKHKTISFVDDYSNALPRLWFDVLLKSEGLPVSDRFFKQIHTSLNANQAVLKTFFKQIDACLVPKKLLKTIFVLNPQLESDLVILRQSEPFIAGVFCTNKKVSESIRKDFIKSARVAMDTDRGKQISLFFRTKEIILKK